MLIKKKKKNVSLEQRKVLGSLLFTSELFSRSVFPDIIYMGQIQTVKLAPAD